MCVTWNRGCHPYIKTLTTFPAIVHSSPTPMSDNCVLPTLKRSSSVRRAAVLETGPLPQQDHKSGTVCHPISDNVGCNTASSGGYWRHFYSGSEATVQCELLLTALNRNILTYLLTYLRWPQSISSYKSCHLQISLWQQQQQNIAKCWINVGKDVNVSSWPC